MKNVNIKRSLRGKRLNYVNVENILNKLGYSIVLFNTPKGDVEIARYNLNNERSTLKAFTYSKTAKIVFVDGTLHSDDILYLLLHELGHICLGHIGDGKLATRNKILIDIEADNFAYSVIKGRHTGAENILLATIILSVSIIFGAYIMTTVPKEVQTIAIETQTPAPTETVALSSDMVYVTPAGRKFHKVGCFHVKGEELTEIPRTQAIKHYAPCSVCNP